MPRESSLNDFGLLIAYLLPGLAALWGVGYLAPGMRAWLLGPQGATTVGGFLLVTAASVAAGILVSTVRWLLVDRLHCRTGIHPPPWDFSRLADRTDAFNVLVEGHYRFYLHYANMLVAVLFTFLARRWAAGNAAGWGPVDVALLALAALYFLGSRDALRKYYARAGELLRGRRPSRRGRVGGGGRG